MRAAYPTDESTAAWATSAESHAEGTDPLLTSPSIPDSPAKINPEDLRSFLKGWSPWGPETNRNW